MNRSIWTERYSKPPGKLPEYDGWLDRWDETFRKRDVERVLDLGCGRGADSEVLAGRGYLVVQTDFVEKAVSFVNRRVGTRFGVVADHSTGLPFKDQSFPAVVADLTLHYFENSVARRILGEIRRVLQPDGLLLARLNSVLDRNYGADQHVPGQTVLLHGVTKQFFTAAHLRELFEGILVVAGIEQYATCCYGRPKQVIEVSAKNARAAPRLRR